MPNQFNQAISKKLLKKCLGGLVKSSKTEPSSVDFMGKAPKGNEKSVVIIAQRANDEYDRKRDDTLTLYGSFIRP